MSCFWSESKILNIYFFRPKMCKKNLDSVGLPLAFAFYLVALCQAVFQQSLLPWMKPYHWVLTDFLWRGNTRTWKSMYLLQPDRTLHHTVSRDDGLVKMRTAPSFCGYNVILLLQYTKDLLGF